MNRQGNPGDITGTDCSGKGGCQCLEMRSIPDIIFFVEFSLDYPDGMTEVTELRKFQVYGKKDPGSKQQYNKPWVTSDETIKVDKKIMNSFHETGDLEIIKVNKCNKN